MSSTAISKKYPFFLRFIIWVLLPAIAVLLYLTFFLRSSLATVSGKIEVAGISQSVKIDRDAQSIPKIQAASNLEAYFGLGFVHAQDRLWQMEMNRRTGAGRLSEVLGKSSRGSDEVMRRIGLYKNARKTWAALDPANRAILQSYVDGVNAGMARLSTLPLEFHLLGFRPEPWRAEDSLVLMQTMAWQLASNFDAEIQRMLLIQHYGQGVATLLMPTDAAATSAGLSVAGMPSLDRVASANMPGLFGEVRKTIGSNAWVIAGRHTASGRPILANDPHLATPIPAIWYLASMKGGALDVVGATMPGLPFVLIGKNQHISWGMTNAMADTQDVVMEEINPTNRDQYKLHGQYVDMQIEREEIRIRADFLRSPPPPGIISVRRTVNGPLLSDSVDPLGKVSFSVKWTGDADTGGTFGSFVKLNYARNWDEFNTALSTYVAPVHNFLYADRDGNIGSLAPGMYPIRSAGAGAIPVREATGGGVWQGTIPFPQVPRIYNPASGLIVTANNKLVPENYPYHISSDWSPSYRAERIQSELQRLISRPGAKITAQDVAALQGDVQAPAARNGVLRKMQAVQGATPAQQRALAMLRAWDGTMAEGSGAAALFAAWSSHLNIELLDQIKAGRVRSVAAADPLTNMKYSDNAEFMERILSHPGPDWCASLGSKPAGGCATLLNASLEDAIAELTALSGANERQWRWGDLHKTVYAHFPFSKVKFSPGLPMTEESAVSTLFDRMVDAPGGNDTVNLASVSLNKDTKYLQFFGPMYRQVVELGTPGGARFMQGTGQSGNPVSPHYDDLIQPNKLGRTVPMDNNKIETTLVLAPVHSKQAER